MKTLIPLLMMVFALGCDEPEVKPVINIPQANERKGGNGNGNGQNNQNTNPCANYPEFPIEYSPSRDFNIKVDTTVCGAVIFRWDAQPGFNPVLDTCYSIARYYYISFSPIGHTNGCTGGGSLSGTNAYYYTLGAGCSVWPGFKYTMAITYIERSETQQKSIWHSSLPITFTAGTRTPWLNNCN